MKIAFVIPFFGTDIPGGAETLCRGLSCELKGIGFEVEILTTCLKNQFSDFRTNYFNEGGNEVDGILVRRFRVDGRGDPHKSGFLRDVLSSWDRNSSTGEKLLFPEEEVLFIDTMAYSDSLHAYIRQHSGEYDLFIFLPYLFATTYYGIMECPGKSVLIPCLHDEAYAYLDIFKKIAESVRGVIFLSEAEKALFEKLYGKVLAKNIVIGAGITSDLSGDKERFLKKYRLHRPILLYVGKIDYGKNIPLLMEYFKKYKGRRPSNLCLVLIGGGSTMIPETSDIINLGCVSHEDKTDAYAASRVFCQPSVKESFSLVMMEAWLAATPVLINELCPVTLEHCIRSNGGLYFRDYWDFEGCMEFYLHNEIARNRMGENGRKYVLSHYVWDKVVERYKDFLVSMKSS